MEIKDKLLLAGKVKLTLTNVKTGKKRISYHNNLITTAGKESIADGLRGNTVSNKGIITYCGLGTDDTAPALGDTQLGTEIERKRISVRTVTNNQALFEIFFSPSEANGALKEAGLFGDDATDTADSGTLFARVAIDRTKSSADTLSLQWTVVVG